VTPDEMKAAAIELFGRRGWAIDLAACLRVDRATVYRWMNGGSVPGPVDAAVSCWMDRFRATGARPEVPQNAKIAGHPEGQPGGKK